MRRFDTTREQNAYELGLKDAANKPDEPLTMDQIKEMTEREIIERKPEVDAVLAERPSDE